MSTAERQARAILKTLAETLTDHPDERDVRTMIAQADTLVALARVTIADAEPKREVA